jgi:hypothetical protein
LVSFAISEAFESISIVMFLLSEYTKTISFSPP